MLLFITNNTIAQEKYTIRGNIKNAPDGKISLISLNAVRQIEVIATTEIKNEKFEFNGEISKPQLVYLKMKIPLYGSEFFLESGEIVINTSFERGQLSPPEVIGSKYFDEIIKPGISATKALMKEILDNYYNTENISKKEKEKLTQNITKKFMAHMEKERIRVSNLYSSGDSWINLLARAYNNRMQYDQLTTMEDMAKLENVIGEHKDITTLKKTLPMRIEAHRLQTMFTVGKNYKDFEVADVDGKMTKFSSVVKKNKIILLDFWASW